MKKRKYLGDNGLSVALFLLFAVSICGHACAGWITNNEERMRDGAPALALARVLSDQC